VGLCSNLGYRDEEGHGGKIRNELNYEQDFSVFSIFLLLGVFCSSPRAQAGYVESDNWFLTQAGKPQGGIISRSAIGPSSTEASAAIRLPIWLSEIVRVISFR
jgi:hypothetical protein